jgi:rod shape-determining protein MreD
MFELKRISIFKKIIENIPILLLLVSVLNEFNFNYIEINFFSFNFPFILIFYWSLKKSEVLGYGYVFIAGLINDVVVGFPLGVSSLSYLLICGFASYLRNITLRPNLLKDWLFFLFTILVINSLMYSLLVLFFSFELDYFNLLSNLFFTFLLYVLFGYFFDIYHRLVIGRMYD